MRIGVRARLITIALYLSAVLAPILLVYATTYNQGLSEVITLTVSGSISGLSQLVNQVITLTVSGSISGLSKGNIQIITLTVNVGTIPVNGAFSVSNADTGGFLYAQYKTYTISSVTTIPGGYAEISTITLGLYRDSTLRALFTYNENTDSISLSSGGTYVEYVAGGSGAVRSGKTITLTINFVVKWGATSEGIYLYQVALGQGGISDSDSANGYVIISSLHLVNLSSSINDSTHVVYTGEIRYNLSSSLYPPDDEFTKIHIHNSAHVSQANEDVHSGAFSVEVEYTTTPANYIYHYYLNMADADYTDADLDGGLITTIISSGGAGDVTLDVTGSAVITLDGVPVTTPDTFTLIAGSTYTLDADNIPSLGVTLNVTGDADISLEGTPVVTPDSFTLTDGATYDLEALDIPGVGGSASGSWMIFLLILVPIGYILLTKRR